VRGDKLYDVIDFILNEASENELEVVRASLKRRVEGGGTHGAMGVDPARIAHRTTAEIREQMGLSVDRIRGMVRGFAADIIRKNAPELDDEQLAELLDAWVTPSEAKEGTAPAERPADAAGASKRRPTGRPKNTGSTASRPREPGSKPAATGGAGTARKDAGTGKRGGLDPAVVLTMVTQFIAYSAESMSVRDQMRLNEEIPDWQRKYWEQFSPRVRNLIKLFLGGEIDKETCIARICADLGIDPE
jgi:hypothetical protein